MATISEAPSTSGAGRVESNGLNVIAEHERKGKPIGLFWPWFASNISVLSIAYGAYVLDNNVDFVQATVASIIGIIISFFLCGIISVAGRRGSAPTMVLSRSAFGVNGNRVSALLSWILTVGWETVLVVLATGAVSVVFTRLGWGGGDVTKAIALAVVAAITVLAGIFGFDLVMRLEAGITILTAILTIIYICLVWKYLSWHTISHMHHGTIEATIGSGIMVFTALGLGWTNCAADYSRYLPRNASAGGVTFWTTFGGSLGPVVLVFFGILLVGSKPSLSAPIGNNAIGALANVLPTWFLVPFLVVAVIGLIAGSVMDIYSSGLSLLSAGLPAPRWFAALIDGAIMTIGSIIIVFFTSNFVGPFEAFLSTVGVPVAAWAGVFIADILLRRRDYAEADLYNPKGRYGSVRIWPLLLIAAGTALGWGLITASVSQFGWEGYLLGPFGLGGKTGKWAYSELGVLVSLVIGFLGTLLTLPAIRHQESFPTGTAPADLDVTV